MTLLTIQVYIYPIKAAFGLSLNMNVKCLIYARYSTSIPINTVLKDASNKALAADVDKIPQKIKMLKSGNGQRNKFKTAYGVWYTTRDENDISYAVCTNETYPERHVYGLIEKLQEKVKQIDHCEYETEENIKAHTKKLAKELVDKYNDLDKIDKLGKAQGEVEELQEELKQGVKKVVGNQSSLQRLNQNSQKIKTQANKFQKNSQSLQKLLYWRDCKIKIIVGLCIVGILGFVIMMIIQHTKFN